MATFRTGFKIFGEISKRQGFNRIRSYSEDRKPVTWKPEDQWAVRESTDTTCPTCPPKIPCRPPPKPSKSWLSIFGCSDPPSKSEPPPCDIRHNNCPPPPEPEGGEEPWFNIGFNKKKKKTSPPPPPESCKMEIARKECEDEVCSRMPRKWPLEEGIPCEPPFWEREEPKPPPLPTFPLPKELDLMTMCGRPSVRTQRLAALCQSDRLPYHEFRPRYEIKKPPFSLPCKPPPNPPQPKCSPNPCVVPFAEFKQVEIPRPLYSRYKSVELENPRFLLCPTDVPCPEDSIGSKPSLAIQPYPEKLEKKESEEETKPSSTYDRFPRVVTGKCKPVRLQNAPTYTFRPKPTKLIERITYRNPCSKLKSCNLLLTPPKPEIKKQPSQRPLHHSDEPKVITSTLTDEPTMFERYSPPTKPPSWMYVITKPGAKETPLVPCVKEYPEEPDWCSETDGLKFYDGEDASIHPKPPKDPCKSLADAIIEDLPKEEEPEYVETPPESECREFITRPVLMPEKYKIKPRCGEDHQHFRQQRNSFDEFIESQTAHARTTSKMFPFTKENIFYDLDRFNCRTSFDPKKCDDECAKPPPVWCPNRPKFFRKFSTFSQSETLIPSTILQRRFKSSGCNKKDGGDDNPFGPCKPPKPQHLFKAKECPEKRKPPDCAEIRLPCCQEARIPPECRDVRFPRVPCKKKLAPRPSFSECSRECPPVPKPTECECWEERNKEHMGIKTPKPPMPRGCGPCRKFSAWTGEHQFGAEESVQSAIPIVPSTTVDPEVKSKPAFLKPKISPAIEAFLRKPPCPSYSDVLREKIENKLVSLTNQRSISSKINGPDYPQPLNVAFYSSKCDKNKKKDKCKKNGKIPAPPCCPEPFDKGPTKTWEDCPTPCICECPIPCDVVEDRVQPGCIDECCPEKPKKPACPKKKKCDNKHFSTLSLAQTVQTNNPSKSLSDSNVTSGLLKSKEPRFTGSTASVSNWATSQRALNSALSEFYKKPESSKKSTLAKNSSSGPLETVPKKMGMRKIQTYKVKSLKQEAAGKRPNMTYRIDSLPVVKSGDRKLARSAVKPKDFRKMAACAPETPPVPEISDPPAFPEIDKNGILPGPNLFSENGKSDSLACKDNEESSELKELLGEEKNQPDIMPSPNNKSLVGSLEAWFSGIFKGQQKGSQKEPLKLQEESTIHHNKIEMTRRTSQIPIARKESPSKTSEEAFFLSNAKGSSSNNMEKGKAVRALSSYSGTKPESLSPLSANKDSPTVDSLMLNASSSSSTPEKGNPKDQKTEEVNADVKSESEKVETKIAFESLKRAIRKPSKNNNTETDFTDSFAGATSLATLDYSKGVPFEINHSARRTELLAENFWSKYHRFSKGKEGSRCCCVRCYSTRICNGGESRRPLAVHHLVNKHFKRAAEGIQANPARSFHNAILSNAKSNLRVDCRKRYSNGCKKPDCDGGGCMERMPPQLEKCNYPKNPPKPPAPCTCPAPCPPPCPPPCPEPCPEKKPCPEKVKPQGQGNDQDDCRSDAPKKPGPRCE